MTEKQLHHEVKEYEGLLEVIAPVDFEARDEEIEYISEIEREVKQELKGGE
jgi:hypothetical protein